MFDYEKRLAELSQQTVLVVGDLMLDRFVYGEVGRISPEAPAPVLRVTREETSPGGSGNVALNIAGLGARCILVSCIGDDDAGRTLSETFGLTGGQIDSKLVIDAGRPTTQKARFVSDQHSTHLLRADWEETHSLPKNCEEEILANALKALPSCGSVVISDYGKGVLTPSIIERVIAEAAKAKKPVIVDPKHHDYKIYKGATLITPNRAELSRAAHRDVRRTQDIVDAARELIDAASLGGILVTRSEEGMTLVPAKGEPVHVPSHAVKVRDVSGAGDTVVATIAAMLAMSTDLEAATRAANAAAAVVIGKRGTAAVNFTEMRAVLVPSAVRAHDEKIARDWKVMDEQLDEWRKQGLRIGFTNGVFDLVHPGHLKVLAGARAACDRLVVGINSDASTRRLKGPARPIQDEVARSEVLAALEATDLVVIFEEDTPLELIKRVRPHVIVKGGDYKREQVVGFALVEGYGGEVIIIDTLPERSTTRLVERSKKPA
jgi:D-beta-D-heptose 7-phosphate kinase/D-beta-D-heptose 1-phosphate adenosyltransferase